MVIRGILDNSLNGQLCIRGFAPIKELAKISEADYTYQRNPIEGRSDIIDFLETQTYLFFPEIILSHKVKHTFEKTTISEGPLSLIQQGKGYKSKIDNTQISVKTIDYKSNQDISGKTIIRIVDLNIDESTIQNGGKPFHRIDGNHRLKAAEHSDNPKVINMVAPFCIILGTEFYENFQISNNPESNEFDKSVKVFFHNINTKTIPLTSEENLKVLIDDGKNFSDADLINIFGGEHPIKTRELIKKANPEIFSGISHILSKQYRTYYNDIFKRLLEGDDKENVIDKVLNSLQAVSQLYNENAKLKSNSSIGILTAFLYYHIENNAGKFNMFKDWILNNHIFEVPEVKATSLIKIFDKISSREIKVFVAMPFFEGNSEIIEDYNHIYNSEIEKIAKEFSVNVSLYPIMQNRGATEDQIQDIINKIKQCEICFADITENNANVLYEMGWARALNKQVIIVLKKDSSKPKSDYANDTYHVYDDKARAISLGKVIRENLIEILTKNYGLINDKK
jgi:nucleoside 2-deoxyribosyltransferase